VGDMHCLQGIDRERERERERDREPTRAFCPPPPPKKKDRQIIGSGSCPGWSSLIFI